MQTLFNLCLALIVVSCPMRCQLGWSDCCGQAPAVVDSVEKCCCNTESEAPAKPAERSDDCKCICSGATMPDAADFVLNQASQAFAWDASVLLTVQSVGSAGETVLLLQSRISVFPCAQNVGRQIRQLQGSLII
ncbi:MAG: hypothetical protein P8K79_01610 [Mariniblastus sp.]|nr:hypothetical protein [Mariniblastus sp.]